MPLIKMFSLPAGKKLNVDSMRKAVMAASREEDDDPWTWPNPKPNPKPAPPDSYIPPNTPIRRKAAKKSRKHLSA